MGRIVKVKNLIEFYVDGKAKPYVLDVNTGIMTGLRGVAISTVPSGVSALLRTGANTSVLRLVRENYRFDIHAKLYALAEKLDAIGYNASIWELNRLEDAIGILNFKDLARYLKNNGTIDEYLSNRMKELWREKNGLVIDDHFTEGMATLLYDSFRSESAEVLQRFAYYLTRGLYEFCGDRWNTVEKLRTFKRNCSALEWDMEKGDFFRLYINADRAYKQNRNMLLDKGISLYQQANKTALSFETDTFTVIIPLTNQQLVNEGNAQGNCVGSYGNRICEQRCNVVFIRRKDNVENSYITCEISRNGHIIQYLSRYNNRVTDNDAIVFEKLYQEHLSTHWGE